MYRYIYIDTYSLRIYIHPQGSKLRDLGRKIAELVGWLGGQNRSTKISGGCRPWVERCRMITIYSLCQYDTAGLTTYRYVCMCINTCTYYIYI